MNNLGTSPHDYTRITPKFLVGSYVGRAPADNIFAEGPIPSDACIFRDGLHQNLKTSSGLILVLVEPQRRGKILGHRAGFVSIAQRRYSRNRRDVLVMEADLEGSN